MFKLTFCSHSEANLNGLHSRKRLLQIFELAGYAAILTAASICAVGAFEWGLLEYVFVYVSLNETFFVVVFGVTLTWSIRRIHTCSKSLEQLGIKSRNLVMWLYILLWLGLALLLVASVALVTSV